MNWSRRQLLKSAAGGFGYTAFAALAAEVPSFMDAVIDFAQRGRSLGVHLVLATQRPAGVVSEAIRANMNLRISLRVQSVTDARDAGTAKCG